MALLHIVHCVISLFYFTERQNDTGGEIVFCVDSQGNVIKSSPKKKSEEGENWDLRRSTRFI